MAALWDLITVPTVNLPAPEASLAMAAKVFQTGLLRDARAADIGWSRVPLGRLHGDRAAATLDRAGVDVRLGVPARTIEPDPNETARRSNGQTIETARTIEPGRPRFTVATDDGPLDADAVIVAVPHDVAGSLLPAGVLPHQRRLTELGTSAVVDVHLVFDRRVTEWPLLAGLGSPVLWVFDRTSSSEQSGRSRIAICRSLHVGRG